MNSIFDIKPLGLIGVLTLSLSYIIKRRFISWYFRSNASYADKLIFLKYYVLEMNQIDWYSLIPLIFLVIIVTPITAINWFQDFYGSSFAH